MTASRPGLGSADSATGSADGGLAARQAELVRAIVTGGPVPSGVDPYRVQVAAEALLHKRAADVARHWPALLASPARRHEYRQWASTRPKLSSFADGLLFARHLFEEPHGRARPASHPPGPDTDERAALELAVARLSWRIGAGEVVRPRRWVGLARSRVGTVRVLAVGSAHHCRWWRR
ncbi:hypothetical protein M6D93_19235 [Jatrophihabitans telluris]|uniref:SCO6045-like C-terminal domain-containing protein n=1 Tax=Jatrophihabitans telluris TaxID=2038343 RepID=A0ABY4QXJ5_9ACTN|nr:hypothetical protein [Jatrophihabitans telluris]UQX88391.1 hypothetical protein M6D93_19235 [Jatrophihabitans telluris]